MATPITDRSIWNVLVEAGLIHRDDHVQRVVIDIEVEDVVRVYTQKVGDDSVDWSKLFNGIRAELDRVAAIPTDG